jgi:hypothetical protein
MIPFDTRRAIEIGTAGEHLVCADLLLAGYRASQAAQGLAYDLILDVSGRLLRVAVKSTVGPRQRVGRSGSRACYQFAVTRSKRDNQGRTTARRYLPEDVDVVALVALDIRQIAYVAISECPASINLFSPTSSPGMNSFGSKSLQLRTMEDFPLSRALEAFT